MLSLSEIAEKYKISMIYLFGSQAEAGKRYIDGEEVSVEPYSDLDIAVYFEEIPPATILTYFFSMRLSREYEYMQRMEILLMNMKSLS